MQISRGVFEQQRRPRFGNSNPERMAFAFWEWMIRGDDVPTVHEKGPLEKFGLQIWTFDRMGATRNRLSGGRVGRRGTGTIFPIYRHHSFRRLRLGIRDWELGSCNHHGGKPPTPPESCNHPRHERAVPLLNQEGSPSVRPASLWRGESAGFPLCLSASVVKVGLGDWIGRPL